MSISKFFLFAFILNITPSVAKAQLTYKELEVRYDSAWTFKNLQLIPIKFKPVGDGVPAISQPYNRPIGLMEAMHKHKIKVQEMQYENGADVNYLQLTNHSKQDVVVQGGEILEGGKQDRMIGETRYIPAGTTDYIQVYCVEKRRWSPKPKEFNHKGVANREVQKAMNVKKRQADVWKEIDKQFKNENKTSETWSYLELYNNAKPIDTSYINFFTRKYVQSDSNLAGFIFITGDHVMSTELFANYGLLDLSFVNMLNSYVQSAISIGSRPTIPLEQVKTFMNKVLISEESQKAYVTTHGKIDRGSDGKIIHLIAYPD